MIRGVLSLSGQTRIAGTCTSPSYRLRLRLRNGPTVPVPVTVDLTKYAGQHITISVENAANDWAWEFGYWARLEFKTEGGGL
ncbi:MAG: hypothetical protein M2R45_03127 [Verrucomicrobia subdivision 3 bacterium]|nr:hypothetical protein [Limisphaerales bacterium]MCS1413195.1 hypothetical protein [Limisphaerales bacterium]